VLLFILILTLLIAGVALLNVPQVGRLLKSVLSGDLAGALTAVPTLNKRIRVGESGALVSSRSDASPDIVVLTTQYPLNGGEQERRLVALSGSEPKLLWQSPPLDRDTYRTPILANETLAYVLQEDRLLALHRTDGSAAWEATLADLVSPHLCVDCVRLQDDRLFTLSDDGTLRATDARTGAPVWEARAVQDSPRGLYVLGDRPAFVDRDENNKGLLRVFDPASGEMQTVQPTCPYGTSHIAYADWTTPLYLSPRGDSFYLVFGSPQVCAQRWDVESMALLWSIELPDNVHTYSSPLVTQDTLYLGGNSEVLALNAATGELRTLLRDDDYEFVPLAMVEDSLLVRAVRQRGSERFAIWSVDTTSSDRIQWTFDLGRNPPLDPPDAHTSIIDVDEPVWTWHLLADELLILGFKRADDDVSHAMLLETLDLQTGASTRSKEVQLGVSTSILSAPEFTIWKQNTLWMSIEGQLLALDAASGEIVYRWP
jgi:outer membrane protein assembly factor BamB